MQEKVDSTKKGVSNTGVPIPEIHTCIDNAAKCADMVTMMQQQGAFYPYGIKIATVLRKSRQLALSPDEKGRTALEYLFCKSFINPNFYLQIAQPLLEIGLPISDILDKKDAIINFKRMLEAECFCGRKVGSIFRDFSSSSDPKAGVKSSLMALAVSISAGAWHVGKEQSKKGYARQKYVRATHVHADSSFFNTQITALHVLYCKCFPEVQAGIEPLKWITSLRVLSGDRNASIVWEITHPFSYYIDSNAAEYLLCRLAECEGFDIDEKNADGATALTYLVRRNKDVNLVRCLLKAGADSNAMCGKNKCTALCIAIMEKNLENVDCLLKYGADPNITLVTGCGEEFKPLDFAILSGAGESFEKKLLSAGATRGATRDAI